MRLAFAVPGDLATPTGGYAYDRRVIAELRRGGFEVAVIGLGDGFPWPGEQVRAAAIETIAAVASDRPVIVDGLALGVLPEVAVQACRSRLIGLVHHPLALESGLSVAQAAALRASERAALAGAAHVIATSAATARRLVSDYGVSADWLTVAPPGNDRVPLSRGSGGGTPALLSVGALVPRKGYDVLVEALARVADLPWRLTIVGDPGRDPSTTATIAADIVRAGLSERITLAGAVSPERLDELYDGCDLFVLASRFEGYGMAYAEAIAHGLPVIGTTAGAIPETVGAAAVLVDAGDVAALAQALRTVVGDRTRRELLAATARQAAEGLPSWEQTGRRFARAIEGVAAMGAS
jgi:glycosyltransferase involved in cell wall biosynthesis